MLTWNEFRAKHKGVKSSEISLLWNQYKVGDYDPPRGVEADEGDETVETERDEEEIQVLDAAEAVVEEIVESYEVADDVEELENYPIDEEFATINKVAEMVDEEHPGLLEDEPDERSQIAGGFTRLVEHFESDSTSSHHQQTIKVLGLFKLI
jgi:hypothetical protein